MIDDSTNLRMTSSPIMTRRSDLANTLSNTLADTMKSQREAEFATKVLFEEKNRTDELQRQLKLAEERSSRADVNLRSLKKRLEDLENQQTLQKQETAQLRNEKSVLITHLQDMQSEVWSFCRRFDILLVIPLTGYTKRPRTGTSEKENERFTEVYSI